MDLDLVSSFTAIKQQQTADQVHYAVAKKAMDSQRAEGEAALQLLQAAAGPASPDGVGTQVDVYA